MNSNRQLVDAFEQATAPFVKPPRPLRPFVSRNAHEPEDAVRDETRPDQFLKFP